MPWCVQEALAVYCLCTVHLGGLSGAAADEDLLLELWTLVARDIDTEAVKWWCVLVHWQAVTWWCVLVHYGWYGGDC